MEEKDEIHVDAKGDAYLVEKLMEEARRMGEVANEPETSRDEP